MQPTRSLLRALALAGALGATAALPAAAQSYQFTNFDGPGDNAGGTTVNGINNSVEVGFSANASATLFTNFLRNTDGSFQILNLGNPFAMANGVNANNAIVGADGNNNAFLLQGGLFSLLPAANPGNTASETAFGINDHGVIVGQYTDNSTDTQPGFVDNGGKFTLLNPVSNALVTNAQGINNNGLVDGFYSTDGVHQHGFLFDTTSNAFTLLPDPNTARTMAGGLVLTQFLGINDLGEAAGYYQTDNGSQFGFLFNTKTDQYRFLDDPQAAPVNGVQVTQITGIDNKGDLSGFYVDANGVARGFEATVAPESGSMLLLLAGLLVPGAALVVRKRSQTA